VVRKALHMLQELGIPVIGVVENFSYFVCPESGIKHEIFGASHAQEIAENAGVELLARLPIDPLITGAGDNGQIENVRLTELNGLAERLLQA